MFTTEGAARCTASWYEPMRTAVGSGPVVGACCTTATCEPTRDGSHSGRKVETTNSAATAMVAACAKMSQRRYMGMRNGSIRNSLEYLVVYERNRGHLQRPSLQSPTFTLPASGPKTTPSP